MENSYFALKTHYGYSKQNCGVFISKEISRATEYNRESNESLHTWSSCFDKVLNTIKCRNTSQLKELYLRNCISICKLIKMNIDIREFKADSKGTKCLNVTSFQVGVLQRSYVSSHKRKKYKVLGVKQHRHLITLNLVVTC